MLFFWNLPTFLLEPFFLVFLRDFRSNFCFPQRLSTANKTISSRRFLACQNGTLDTILPEQKQSTRAWWQCTRKAVNLETFAKVCWKRKKSFLCMCYLRRMILSVHGKLVAEIVGQKSWFGIHGVVHFLIRSSKRLSCIAAQLQGVINGHPPSQTMDSPVF